MAKVSIKNLDVKMEVKNRGVEFQVDDNDGQLGDCVVTKANLNWCKGQTTRPNGTKIKWSDLAEILLDNKTKNAALKAARAKAKES